ncbi:MAG: glutamate--tRNA ligase [Candidatus Sumerlaeaceae bacterium]|nr:glutamate--tRNA ligase [Candidatus Sumerlaeaceae bacterium]
MTHQQIRVRFAPSPTGFLHVGSARAALFNYLFARHTGGVYLLRIEDTDLERSTPEATRQILDSLAWLGLEPDEPPVYQAQRADLHRAFLERLLASGHAYRCHCPKERLEQLRAEARAAGTIFAYRREMLEPGEAERYAAQGLPSVIRFRSPVGETVGFDDMVYGRIEVETDTIGDFVIARGDGSPLYNFTNVADDIDMGITHICRGEDHVPNTPKQVLIYRALGAEPPQFAHLPLILGPDKQKLSKRHGATGVNEFRDKGILPQALVNFLALLGWSPGEAEFDEVMTVEELAAKFSLDQVKRSPAVFDHEKLLWMNGAHIRRMPRPALEEMVIGRLTARFGFPERPAACSRNAALAPEAWVRGIIGLVVERSRTLCEFEDNLAYFFEPPSEYDAKAMKKFVSTPEQAETLRATGRLIGDAWERVPPPGPDGGPDAWAAAVEQAVREPTEAAGRKFGQVAQPVRLALTGRTASPPLFHVIWFLGREETLRRIEACAAAAGTSP